MRDFAHILDRAGRGEEGASEQLASIVYEELKTIARREMRGERMDHTLQPTALVHEAYMRLLGPEGQAFDSRGHFFSAAAAAIRRVLVDHARRRSRQKRGGDVARVDFDRVSPVEEKRDARLLAVDEALERLRDFDPDKALLIELRFFAGMSVEEVARARGISPSTVARDWRLARAWLHGELAEGIDGECG